MIYVDADDDIPLRGKVEITWQDSRSGWGEEPTMGGWHWHEDTPLDPHRRRLLLASLLDWAEQHDPPAPIMPTESTDDDPAP